MIAQASFDPAARLAHYQMLRSRGFSHEDAERLAHGKYMVNLQTDTVFMAGSHEDDGFGNDNEWRKRALKKARAAGVSTTGKRYHPGLASEPCDPRAWYDSKGYVEKRVREMGKSCEGAVNVEQVIPDAPHPVDKPYRCAPDMVDNEVAEVIREKHGGKVSVKKFRDIQEGLIEKHSGRG